MPWSPSACDPTAACSPSTATRTGSIRSSASRRQRPWWPSFTGWSDAAILEEHAFSLELAREEIPVIAPLTLDGVTLHRFGEFRFSLFPRRGGR